MMMKAQMYLPDYLQKITDSLDEINKKLEANANSLILENLREMNELLQAATNKDKNTKDDADTKQAKKRKKGADAADGKEGTPSERIQHVSMEELQECLPDGTPAL